MKYYRAYFSHTVICKFSASDEIELISNIRKYLKGQNFGEAKSDKLIFKRFEEISKEDFDKVEGFDKILSTR